MSSEETDYNLKKMKKEKQYKPKLIQEKGFIDVENEIKKPLAPMKKCKCIIDNCYCNDYDNYVKNVSKKYY
jgi:hypothetical protein